MRVLSFFSLAFLTGLAALALSAPPPQADLNREYAVTPEVAKWMICAASYTGPESPDLAHQLVEQLRTRDNLPAYTYSRSDVERQKQAEEDERLKKMYPDLPSRRRRVRIEEQWAVLIGGWPDAEAAGAFLTKIKKLPMPTLKTASGESPHGYIWLGKPDEEKKRTNIFKAEINPFANAFVIRNPTAPVEQKPAAKFDPLWKKLNAEEDYSLLKNPKSWTLVVKEYQGATSIQSGATSGSGGFLDKLFGSGKAGEALNASAAQAHEVARVLKQLKFSAYVMHTRTSSIVTVGEFEGLEDPNMQRTAETIAKLKLGPIDLLTRPMPMEVPRP